MARCRAAGSRRVACAAAARGIPAVTIRFRERGYPATHPACHLRLFGAHALGGMAKGDASEAAGSPGNEDGHAPAQ